MKHIKSIDEFKDLVKDKKVALMIHKEGCPFCEKAEPWVEELSQELKDREVAAVKKEDVEKLVDIFNVKMYPTFALLENGIVKEVFFGDTQKDKVRDFLTKDF